MLNPLPRGWGKQAFCPWDTKIRSVLGVEDLHPASAEVVVYRV